MQLEVDAMQAEAVSARAAAESRQAAVLEVERLGQDNALLAARLSQMDLDLQVCFLLCKKSPFNLPYAGISVRMFGYNTVNLLIMLCAVSGLPGLVSQRSASASRSSVVPLSI